MGKKQHAHGSAHTSLHALPAQAHAPHEELCQPVLSRHSHPNPARRACQACGGGRAGTNYVETLRVQIHANCRLRRVYFSDRLYAEEELPPEFKLFLPVHK